MKYYELDKEEKELLEEFEKGEWLPVKNQAKAKKKAMVEKALFQQPFKGATLLWVNKEVMLRFARLLRMTRC